MIATIISRIFEPFLMFTCLFILLFYRTDIFIPALLWMVALPFFLFLIVWKMRVVGNWDVSNRRQRPKLLWALLCIEALGSVVLKTDKTVPFLIALFGFTLITHVWKISGHVMAAALVTGYLIFLYGWGWWPVLVIVPLVSWSRVVRKDHTLAQVVVGAIYSWGLLLITYYISRISFS